MQRLAIIGAGVLGLLTAIQAPPEYNDIIILEAEHPGAGATGHNAGVLHQIQPPPGKNRRRLMVEGHRLWEKTLSNLGIEYLETRLIIPALTRAQAALLPLLALTIKAIAPHTRPHIINRKELQRIEPMITPQARRAILVEGYKTLDPRQLAKALAEKTREQGAQIIKTKAEKIKCTSSGVTIEHTNGTLEVDKLVNTAGVNAHHLARQLGVNVRVELAPGTMTLHDNPGVDNMIAPPPSLKATKSKGGAIIPWPRERLLLGPTLEPPGHPPTPPGKTMARYTRLLREPPGKPHEVIIGYRTIARPRDFHIRKDTICGNTIHALGIESPGLTAAPAIANIITTILHNGEKFI